MTYIATNAEDLMPRWLRLTLIALATLVLCSCRAPRHDGHLAPPTAAMPPAVVASSVGEAVPTLPSEAFTGAAEAQLNPYSPQVLDALRQWQPSGLTRPWPREEYLRDGGDYIVPARVNQDWTVDGLDQEDAVAHYDTLDGRRVVQPSNRVHIYAPRFAAVRRVENLQAHETHDHVAGVEIPTRAIQQEDRRLASTTVQPVQPIGEVGTRAASLYRGRQQGGGLKTAEHLAEFHEGFLPYENLAAIRYGILDQAEKARLAERIQAAIAWSSDQAVQVVLDRKAAIVGTKSVSAEAVYRVDEPHSPALRVIKVASTATARPGETVDFTLRFDNMGDQVIGNVTLLDNLSSRLQYVPDSQQASVAVDFAVESNQGGSQVLRWDVTDPLEPGDGGIVRFRCLVR